MTAVAAVQTTVAKTTSASALPVLREGMRSPQVARLQSKLKAAGFDPGPVDGIFGSQTEAAVKAFQRARGIVVDGVVGPQTWGKLGVEDRKPPPAPVSAPTLRLGARGEAVRMLQQRLRAVGFSSIVVDGSFGPQTLGAVKAFQRSRGLTVDGVVGPKTWAKLGVSGGGSVTPPSNTGANPYYADFVSAARKAGVPTSWASNPALIELVKHESGFRPTAKNPTSTAFGLFQFLSSTWKAYLPEVGYGSTSPYWQAVGGFRYLKQTYGTPERAWAFWRATVYKNASLAPADLQSKARYWIARNYAGY